MPSFEFISYNEDDTTRTQSFDLTKDKDAVELLNMIADDDYKNLTEGFMNEERYAQRWLNFPRGNNLAVTSYYGNSTVMM